MSTIAQALDMLRATARPEPPPPPPRRVFPVRPDPRVEHLRARVVDIAEETLARCDLTSTDGNLLAAIIVGGRDHVLRQLGASR